MGVTGAGGEFLFGWLKFFSHGPLSSSFLGLPYRILNMNHKKELLRGLRVEDTFTVGCAFLESWILLLVILNGDFCFSGLGFQGPLGVLGFRVLCVGFRISSSGSFV